jgi:hypothetical protein
MEGAVRSGYLAAEAITGQKFVVAIWGREG